ncbi:hypothetical protein G3580_06205 [Nitrogeniibacter mangrovi]|uniref:Uncharacterized protein n=1 Tax=Nitrogeniibacter mangrovi TaxID=2016596 RepID=A0A6C1B4Y7_9RHOO|nr:hypothetical protein [Nitrogeniibacter mangrovi]QID17274.1 hypothetical protein G3580_06205 [Nitrogeniibacter mangrovi]
MHIPFLRRLGAIAMCSIVMAACTSNPSKDVAEEEQPLSPAAIHKIALIRVLNPVELTAENRGGPLPLLGAVGWIAQRHINANRGQFLEQVFRNQAFLPGDELTNALLAELRDKGYSIEYLRTVPRDLEDPSDILFDAIQTDADAFLVVELDEMGIYSGVTSTKFMPRLNVDVELLGRIDQSEVFSQSIEYGVDADEHNDEEIPADPKYAYGSFGEAVEHQTDLIEGFRRGIGAIAASIVRQLRERGVDAGPVPAITAGLSGHAAHDDGQASNDSP